MIKPADINNIIIRSPNWVGDVVMATPAFRCIRENFPNAKITVAFKSYVQKLIDGAPWFDEILVLDSNNVTVHPHLNLPPPPLSPSLRGTGGGIQGNNEYSPPLVGGVRGGGELLPNNQYSKSTHIFSLVKQIRFRKYDLGFLFSNSFSSALVFWLGGVKRRVGYKRDARSWLLTNGINRLYENGRFCPTYMGDYYLRLCIEMGCEIRSKELELFINKESQRCVDEIFRDGNLNNGLPLILLNPGAAYGSSKCWTAEGFARTADLINQQLACNIAIVCAPNEIQLARDIEQAAKSRLINLANQIVSLDILKALIKRCALLITVDSGPRHIAVAFKRPVVTLMGPNDPRYTESPSEIGQVIRADVDCLACHLKVCPKDHRCMTWIKPEQVAIAGLELIQKGKL